MIVPHLSRWLLGMCNPLPVVFLCCVWDSYLVPIYSFQIWDWSPASGLKPLFFHVKVVLPSPLVCLGVNHFRRWIMHPWAKKELLKQTFVYTIHLKIRELRESGGLCKRHEWLIKVVECSEDELVCRDGSSNPNAHFFFFHTKIFTKIKLCLPLTIFEKEILTELNVSPIQLHLNNWAFIRTLFILCSYFGITSTTYVFCWTRVLVSPNPWSLVEGLVLEL